MQVKGPHGRSGLGQRLRSSARVALISREAKLGEDGDSARVLHALGDQRDLERPQHPHHCLDDEAQVLAGGELLRECRDALNVGGSEDADGRIAETPLSHRGRGEFFSLPTLLSTEFPEQEIGYQ